MKRGGGFLLVSFVAASAAACNLESSKDTAAPRTTADAGGEADADASLQCVTLGNSTQGGSDPERGRLSTARG